ncbi:MAG: hypothetical protein R6X09_00685 [Bacteroidales bacterium]
MKIKTVFKTTAIAVITLGCIHTCATPVIFGLFKGNVKIDPAALYMFIMVGMSTIFIGWLQYFLVKQLTQETDQKQNSFKKILLVTVVYLSILGSGAVIAMPDNPFAYISLLLAIVEVFSYSRFSN